MSLSRSARCPSLALVPKHRSSYAHALITTLSLSVMAAVGCSVRPSTFEFLDYNEPGEAKHYREVFDEAYYKLDEHGNADIVLRRSTGGETYPNQPITQIIHIHTIWRSIPGNTVASRTQINGTVIYYVLSGRLGETFEGAGSVFYKHKQRGNVLAGRLDLASLRPKRTLTAGTPVFKRLELSGEFHATHDPRRVVRIVNELNCLFGASPPSQSPGLPAP